MYTSTTGFEAYYMTMITVMIVMITIRAATIPTANPAMLLSPPDWESLSLDWEVLLSSVNQQIVTTYMHQHKY